MELNIAKFFFNNSNRGFMKKSILILLCILLVVPLFSSDKNDIPSWATPDSMYKKVEKELKHEIKKYEKTIIDTTYLYYYNKCERNWNRKIWKEAVTKAVEMCKNDVAVAAAKTGLFGEKLLKTLAVTAEDAVSGFNNWIDSGSQKFEERHNP